MNKYVLAGIMGLAAAGCVSAYAVERMQPSQAFQPPFAEAGDLPQFEPPPAKKPKKPSRRRGRGGIGIGFEFDLSDLFRSREEKDREEADEAAEDGLKEMRDLARTESSMEFLGVESPEEVDRASLGEPFTVLTVQYDDLVEYEPGDLEEIFSAVRHSLYPVIVDDEVRSVIRVAPAQKRRGRRGMKAVQLGAPAFMQRLNDVALIAENEFGDDLDAMVFVEVLPLRMDFVMVASNDERFLAPLNIEPGLGMEFGVFEPADEILDRLREAAEAFDPSAPG